MIWTYKTNEPNDWQSTDFCKTNEEICAKATRILVHLSMKNSINSYLPLSKCMIFSIPFFKINNTSKDSTIKKQTKLSNSSAYVMFCGLAVPFLDCPCNTEMHLVILYKTLKVMDMEHLWPQLHLAPTCDFCHLITPSCIRFRSTRMGLWHSQATE